MTLNVAFDFPPTQAEIDQLEAQMQIASVILCDATEGQVRIRQVNITDSSASQENADILVQAADGRSSASGPHLGDQGEHVNLLYSSIAEGPTIAHELGHFLFGIGDSYPEGRRFGTAVGIGRSIETADEDPQDQTLMQHSGKAQCGSFTGICPDPTWTTTDCFRAKFNTSGTSTDCSRNTDCLAGDICYFAFGTEFSVPQNHDLVNGIVVTRRNGATVPPYNDPPGYPMGGTPTIAAQFVATLGTAAAIQAFDSTSLASAKATSAAWRRVELIDSIGNPHLELDPTDLTTEEDLGPPRVGNYSDGSMMFWAFLERSGATEWRLHLAIDARQQSGTTDQGHVVLRIIDAIGITGGATPVVSRQPRLAIGQLLTGALALDITTNIAATASAGAARLSANANADVGAPVSMQVGNCELAGTSLYTTATAYYDAVACNALWNTQSLRYETAAHTIDNMPAGCVGQACIRSDWTVLSDNFRAHNRHTLTLPAAKPTAAIPVRCSEDSDADGNWDPVEFKRNFAGATQIMIAVDRSKSMSKTITGSQETRQDYAREAINTFLDLRVNSGLEVGLLSFAEDSTVLQGIQALDAAHQKSIEDDVAALKSGNFTDIGGGLLGTMSAFDAASSPGQDRLVVLVSDGRHTADGGGLIGFPSMRRPKGTDPDVAASALQKYADGPIRLFTIPVSAEADRDTLGRISSSLGGSMIDAAQGDELIPIFAELAATAKGNTLVLPRTPSAVAPCGYERVCRDAMSFRVEEGAAALELTLSTRNASASTWSPDFQLMAPNGAVFTRNAPQVTVRGYYMIVRIPNPAAGMWKLDIMSSNGPQLSYAIASVDNPMPKCAVSAYPKVSAGGSIKIRVAPQFHNTLESYSSTGMAAVQVPGGAYQPVALRRDRINGGFVGEFNAPFHGSYSVIGFCEGTAASTQIFGDTITGKKDSFVPVDPFTRFNGATFFVSNFQFPVCTVTDCDGDGIPNATEGTADADGDGLPNNRDTDSDNDEIPDSVAGSGDTDRDGIPNFRDPDMDGDGKPNGFDNCPLVANSDQKDADGDGVGNVCDVDRDNDGAEDSQDTCPDIFNPRQNAPPCRSPAKTDFDNDGEPDVLWRGCLTGKNNIWSADGNSFDVSSVGRDQSAAWYVVGVGDFTKDGQPDVLWQNTLLGTTRIWEMTGTRVAAELVGPSISTAFAWYGAGVGDFNRDGHADIITRQRITGSNRVWLMNKNAIASTVDLPVFSTLAARLAGVEDLNNDGNVDLLWHDPLTTQLTLWRMNGTSRLGIDTFWGPALPLAFYVGALDDFDGDGKTDILWHSPWLSYATAWRMNGTTKLGEYTISGPPLYPWLPLSTPPGVIAASSGGGLCGGG